jgi:23S rRNA G2069 N7-methylase RlmK/C1962 C5-methylase RlmI
MKIEAVSFEYYHCPLNSWTFQVKDIRQFAEKHSIGRVLNLYAGKTKLTLNEFRVDKSSDFQPDYCGDALTFLNTSCFEKFDTVILDPPYSERKSMEFYKGHRASPFAQVVDSLLPHLKENALVITFGYSSSTMGKKRGFHQHIIAMFSHGGAYHDTIGVVERRGV